MPHAHAYLSPMEEPAIPRRRGRARTRQEIGTVALPPFDVGFRHSDTDVDRAALTLTTGKDGACHDSKRKNN